ncbi:NAD(P)-binding protein [Fictibacillus barbaricus]|uniref:precorrin-2 dehydrogenase n=1 Tax=Fictibacillus barbaricus TaxID=182136 RepID=A0ABS2ZFF4_9BACL|nr:NAD(P)-binding protein [Fictibacillus barbaricus]MBN3545465.1 NAD(P)-binding protein [Fictibacillus barbaricus]GGB53629.1 precorrin-2 dehydrogenase [Fictibacillus barbaricus]
MDNYYPVMLKMKGKRAVVVGGGKIAERKIKGLLEAGADILVISPKVTDKLLRLATDKTIKWEQKSFEPADIKGAFLVITAVNERAVNQSVQDSITDQQLFCRSDDQGEGNFILPSLFRQGKLTIAVSTSGASPGMAKKITAGFSSVYDDTFGEYLDFLDQCRKYIRTSIKDPDKRKRILTEILDEEFLNLSHKEREERFLGLCIERG